MMTYTLCSGHFTCLDNYIVKLYMYIFLYLRKEPSYNLMLFYFLEPCAVVLAFFHKKLSRI